MVFVYKYKICTHISIIYIRRMTHASILNKKRSHFCIWLMTNTSKFLNNWIYLHATKPNNRVSNLSIWLMTNTSDFFPNSMNLHATKPNNQVSNLSIWLMIKLLNFSTIKCIYMRLYQIIMCLMRKKRFLSD